MSDLTTSPTPDSTFDDLANLLVPVGALNSPAELHGWACGSIVGGLRFEDRDWLRVAVDFLDVAGEVQPSLEMALIDLYRDTLTQLQADPFGLALVLPDDSNAMSVRTETLAQWCHGFLTGLGSTGMSVQGKLTEETAEALQDFAAIVQVDSQDVDEDEQAEHDFLQISEYVRMTVASLYMELNEGDGSKSESTVH